MSKLHRVVNVPLGAGVETRRRLLVFFHNPKARHARATPCERLRRLFTATQNA